MENDYERIEENLKITIAEAKNLPESRDSFIKVTLDQEPVFETGIFHKSTTPFYGEEFQCEIPCPFRYLSFYLCKPSNKQNKVVGKVCLPKNSLQHLHGKDHWFSLKHVHSDSEVLGKVHLELSVNPESNEASSETKHELSANHPVNKLCVRVIECEGLGVVQGSCNPYASVTLSRLNKNKNEIKHTACRKKTTNPSFNESFYFDLNKSFSNSDKNLNRISNSEKNLNNIDSLSNTNLSVSLWHDDSRMLPGHYFPGHFLGEVRLFVSSFEPGLTHEGWYLLKPREQGKYTDAPLGSLRLRVSYTSLEILPSKYYRDLKNLLLQSLHIKPVVSSAAYILGQSVKCKECMGEAAQPLVRLFYQNGQIVQLISFLADYEISKTSDPNTIFRGNTLPSKCIDELMKLVGLHYLRDTLKETIDEIFNERKSCEIDKTRFKESENYEMNFSNLKHYVEKIFKKIVYSGLSCPTIMCEVFYAIKESALRYFPENERVRYQVVSGFVFLRFFAPAILGPQLFQLRKDTPDSIIYRTLTLISKAIQGLGNSGSMKKVFGFKEEFMVPLFQNFTDISHVKLVKEFLDIISSLSRMHSKSIEAPVVFKEGYLTKRSQGRKRFGVKNFKHRFFCLTNYTLSYYKQKGASPLCQIPTDDILGVEDLQEQSFTRKYMLQILQKERPLYVQASNCVEFREWKNILIKVCNMNKNRLQKYHPAAYLHGHWLCCKCINLNSEGCTNTSPGIPTTVSLSIESIDLDRELERIYQLYSSNYQTLIANKNYYKEQLNGEHAHTIYSTAEVDSIFVAPTSACANDSKMHSVVRNFSTSTIRGDSGIVVDVIDEPTSSHETLSEIVQIVSQLNSEHQKRRDSREKNTVLGSHQAPFGDNYCYSSIIL